MTSYTRTSLAEALIDYLEDNSVELANRMEDIICNGLEMVVRDLDLEIFTGEKIGSFQTGLATVSKDANNLKIKTIRWQNNLGVSQRLLARSRDFCDEFSPNPTVVDEPRYYTDDNDSQITVFPTPDSNYTYTMRFIKRPLLDASNPTNWISVNCGDLLLYSCLIQAERFLMTKEVGRSGEWEVLYASQMTQAREEFDDIRRKAGRPMQASATPESSQETRSK